MMRTVVKKLQLLPLLRTGLLFLQLGESSARQNDPDYGKVSLHQLS